MLMFFYVFFFISLPLGLEGAPLVNLRRTQFASVAITPHPTRVRCVLPGSFTSARLFRVLGQTPAPQRSGNCPRFSIRPIIEKIAHLLGAATPHGPADTQTFAIPLHAPPSLCLPPSKVYSNNLAGCFHVRYSHPSSAGARMITPTCPPFRVAE